MKEKYPYAGNPNFRFVGMKVIDKGALVETEYYYHGWIPLTEFTNGDQPVYTHGWSGPETVIRTQGIKPAVVVSVTDKGKA